MKKMSQVSLAAKMQQSVAKNPKYPLESHSLMVYHNNRRFGFLAHIPQEIEFNQIGLREYRQQGRCELSAKIEKFLKEHDNQTSRKRLEVIDE